MNNEKENNAGILSNIHKNQDILNEINDFAGIISNGLDMFNGISSSYEFWENNFLKFPHLSKVFLILSGINSSSAFIERFFSICGIIGNKKNCNMSQDLFFMRAMLAGNIELLNKCSEDA